MDERILRILSKEEYNKIVNTHILIVGIGGVGGSAFESLVRMGIKYIDIIDYDIFDISNLNRQILSNINNIGQKKIIEAQIRAKSINPDIIINSYDMFLDESNIDEIEYNKYDYIIDCCDSVNTKILLIKKSIEHNIKIISSMGTGNRLDPTKLEITNIWKTDYDPLAKKIRSILRKERINKKIPVVTSKEIPRKSNYKVGSTSLVPNSAGILCASYIISDIIK